MGQYRLGEWSLRKERRGCDKGTGASLPHAKDRDMHTPPLPRKRKNSLTQNSYCPTIIPQEKHAPGTSGEKLKAPSPSLLC